MNREKLKAIGKKNAPNNDDIKQNELHMMFDKICTKNIEANVTKYYEEYGGQKRE